VGSIPAYGAAFDGQNVWIANQGDGTISRL
jgi:hypothetical protein